jgi:hypothetical protein
MQGHHRARERLRPRHKSTAVHARGDCQDQANGWNAGAAIVVPELSGPGADLQPL